MERRSRDLAGMASNIAMLITALCAVVVTVLVVQQKSGSPGPGAPGTIAPVPLSDSLWQLAADGGRELGGGAGGADGTNAIRLVVFSDFECVYCRRFALSTLPGLRAEFGGRLRVQFRHWPLANHRLALPAALAAECAGEQGKFSEFHDRTFAAQDSIGVLSFNDLAQRSGVADLDRFRICTSEPMIAERVQRDRAMAVAIRGTGTPTILLEGRHLAAAETDSAGLSLLVRKLLASRD